ncbi:MULTISPECIES: hypothetical protein [unclassified Microbacterium]|uniref:hypothetical protein n=1 Tax=unclassified Microbacterium TaxID=2609290 RepID=UPI002469815F|nr:MULTISPECIES: hypothetical protein [unclassified Microbacterium]MDH5135045.1 hypothetical protein [Microbacterium sp. RD10]MDH5138636.1 hypothetical protein [Microbacterium sp. RD11]MDH5147082.1 hypothetical protein [Microbacterium sp. RD12]MDH5156705.1 hypothetical protein [Microbacterium sp. RD06]MDH5168197.1 hypothetical protein [Microbacterium sp. RD02]
MNYAIAIIGAPATLLTILFIIIWAFDDLKTASIVIGSTVAMTAAALGIVAFWLWVAGAFA